MEEEFQVADTPAPKKAKKTDESGHKMVSVRLVRAKDDPPTHPVIINGFCFNVRRGKEVEVPENVALALIHSRHIGGYPGFNPEDHPGVVPPPLPEDLEDEDEE